MRERTIFAIVAYSIMATGYSATLFYLYYGGWTLQGREKDGAIGVACVFAIATGLGVAGTTVIAYSLWENFLRFIKLHDYEVSVPRGLVSRLLGFFWKFFITAAVVLLLVREFSSQF